MTDAKKELAESAYKTAEGLGMASPQEKARRELAEHLANVANWLGEIEGGFKTLAMGEMNQGEWKMFALALFDFVQGPDIHAEILFEDASEVNGMTMESFGAERWEAINQIRADLMSILLRSSIVMLLGLWGFYIGHRSNGLY